MRVITGVLIVGLAASGCANSHQSLRSKMRSWASDQNYVGADTTVREDLANIAAGLRLRDLEGLRTVCVGFSADVDQIYASLPAPDRSVTHELNIALTKFWGPGAQLCYGATSLASAKMAAFERDLKLGEAWFAEAESRIRSYGVH